MSRLIKKPIIIPVGVTVSSESGLVKVKGPQGELSLSMKPEIKMVQENGFLNFSFVKKNKQVRALSGTYVSHVKNMIQGVTKKYEKKLILEGVGYKSEVKNNNLLLALGFSHPVSVLIPDGITVTAEKNIVSIQGVDKGKVGEFAAKIRDLKKPEPYKGKGFRYEGEIIKRKQGKKTV